MSERTKKQQEAWDRDPDNPMNKEGKQNADMRVLGEAMIRDRRPAEPDPKPKPKPSTKMAKGGSVSTRADGCAQKGKTRGKMR